MIRTVLWWGLVVAVLVILITRPAETANFILTIIGGIVEFFKQLVNGIMNLV